MASKTVSLKEETYDRLVSVKGEDESFSDVIDRLLREGDHPLYDLVGVLDEREVEALRERSARFRESVDSRMSVEDEP